MSAARPLPAFLQNNRAAVQAKFNDLEWEQRQRLAQAATDSPFLRIHNDDTTRRNRYANIDPFDLNRVRLRNVPDGESDYINASNIVLGAGTANERRYIATQGPKESSAAHLWRMVAHETTEPAVVVMLTQTHEAGREKCWQYFPRNAHNPSLVLDGADEPAPTADSQATTTTVTLKGKVHDARTRSTLRELRLETAGADRTVWHYLFEGWPDFGVPEGEDRAALTALVRETARKAAGTAQDGKGSDNSLSANARVVHCSAGVGRSGTFIALDYLLAELESGRWDELPDDRDPIAETVDELRKQRMMMVQGDSQFWYLYQTMRECWEKPRAGEAEGEGKL